MRPSRSIAASILTMSLALISFEGLAYDFSYTDDNNNTLYFEVISKNGNAHRARVTYGGSINEPIGKENIIKGEIVIPACVIDNGKNYDITQIGPMAFAGQTGISGIKMPETIDSIAPFAFDGCENLIEITYPKKQVKVSDDAFNNCKLLRDVNFGSSWKEIDFYPYRWSENLKDIKIPFGTTLVKNFEELSYLENISLSEPVDENEKSTYDTPDNCLYHKETKSLKVPVGIEGVFEIPESVNEITGNTFWGCSKIEKIIIPSQLSKISYDSFSTLENLHEIEISSRPKGNILTNLVLSEPGKSRGVLLFVVWNPEVTLYVPEKDLVNYNKCVMSNIPTDMDINLYNINETGTIVRDIEGSILKNIKAKSK
ncbi:MAG: leucine-rich repeat domain-containing protein [Prevotella sp.]|nr:leucine-rich repeat domain-containing protein [Bacteroides sp.]MCM1366423.1 leucine-rich repeat domain-containing protein [Prevotella sp.]